MSNMFSGVIFLLQFHRGTEGKNIEHLCIRLSNYNKNQRVAPHVWLINML